MNRERLAEKISDIFNPYYLSTPFFLVVVAGSSQNLISRLTSWLVAVLFFSFLPMWDIKRRVRVGLVGDAHISRREDRIKPFLFSLGCAIGGLFAVYAIGAPVQLKAVSWAVVIAGAVITVTTAYWKISLHAAGISSVAMALTILYGPYLLPTFLFVPVVAWARLVLKKHTPTQILAGITAALTITSIVFWRFGLL